MPLNTRPTLTRISHIGTQVAPECEVVVSDSVLIPTSTLPVRMDVEIPGLEPEALLDLVGGPFSVIESDPGRDLNFLKAISSLIHTPGVFTTLIRKLGIKHLQFEEVYDIQTPHALSSLSPKALVLCFVWKHDKHHPTEFDDPAAKQIWFANQLSDDACASLAILNVINNLDDVDAGEVLRRFKEETLEMSSVVSIWTWSISF
jgi:ubiquitin carboxyl-terminal hydrolase L5